MHRCTVPGNGHAHAQMLATDVEYADALVVPLSATLQGRTELNGVMGGGGSPTVMRPSHVMRRLLGNF